MDPRECNPGGCNLNIVARDSEQGVERWFCRASADGEPVSDRASPNLALLYEGPRAVGFKRSDAAVDAQPSRWEKPIGPKL